MGQIFLHHRSMEWSSAQIGTQPTQYAHSHADEDTHCSVVGRLRVSKTKSEHVGTKPHQPVLVSMAENRWPKVVTAIEITKGSSYRLQWTKRLAMEARKALECLRIKRHFVCLPNKFTVGRDAAVTSFTTKSLVWPGRDRGCGYTDSLPQRYLVWHESNKKR